jgi:uncharacterized membrane protein (UPF0182 family)
VTVRRSWVRAAVVSALAILLVGRWVAVRAADRLWAQALRAGATHAAIANLKLMLLAIAFALAAVWSLGNLYLIYRTIGSVHVPRRLGNVEIVEAVPRRYLLYGTVGLGLVIAVLLSHTAGSWWPAFALSGSHAEPAVRDPVLHRDLAYYLFRLPWERTLQGYLATLSVVMLAVVAGLYGLVGAIRVERRHVEVADVARMHLGGLLTVFAVVLAIGFHLDPAEYIAGLRGVPYDAVLVHVRLPVSRLLGGVALAVALASLVWIWVDRVAIVVASWATLAALALGGTFVAPAFSAAVRRGDRLADPSLLAAQHRMLGVAYGLPLDDTTIAPPATPSPDLFREAAATLRLAPIWDATTLTGLLNRLAVRRPFERFEGTALEAYTTGDGRTLPVFVAVRVVDLLAARAAESTMTWADVHVGRYSHAIGAVAVPAAEAGATGLPLFLTDLAHPETASATVTDLDLTSDEAFFAPTLEDYAVVRPQPARPGIRPGGLFRRLALAWALQSPRLLSHSAVPSDAAVLWRRDVAERLTHYAPFAQFGAPWPVVSAGHLQWLAWGYVSADGFPLSVATRWRGTTVRYLRAALVGRVDASTGATAVYLVGQDPLSEAWARVAPQLVRPGDQLPPALRAHLRYPEGLFRVQAALIGAGPLRGRPAVAPRAPVRVGGAGMAPAAEPLEPAWLVGSLPGDAAVRTRIRWSVERGTPPMLAAVVDGAATDSGPVLRVDRLAQPLNASGATDFRSRTVAALDPEAYVAGPVKVFVYSGGVVLLQTIFAAAASDSEPPKLHEVAVAAGSAVGHGPDAVTALRDLELASRLGDRSAASWSAARQWFRRLDAARRAGDWAAFGRAYEALRRLLAPAHDSVP